MLDEPIKIILKIFTLYKDTTKFLMILLIMQFFNNKGCIFAE